MFSRTCRVALSGSVTIIAISHEPSMLESADLVLVVDCDVPWYPNKMNPPEATRIIQAGVDPFYSRYTIRGFPSDLTLLGDPARVLSEINRILNDQVDVNSDAIVSRKQKLLIFPNLGLKVFQLDLPPREIVTACTLI